MGQVNKMDRAKKIDMEVKKIHTGIKKANLILRERIRDIQADLTEWNLSDGRNDKNGENFLH